MKLFLRLSVVVFLMAAVTTSASAQKMKFGYIKSDEIIKAMPEYINAAKVIEEENKKMAARIQEMRTEAQKIYNAYLENQQLNDASPEKWKGVELQDKEAELNSLQQRIEAYGQSAQAELAKKENELMQPVSEKFKNAIAEVGKENGLIDVKEKDSMYYYSEANYMDISELVKKKLGI